MYFMNRRHHHGSLVWTVKPPNCLPVTGRDLETLNEWRKSGEIP